jgi:hypothetical protein
VTRLLYADFSPGYAWDGRDSEALEVATATQASTRTVDTFDADVVAAMDALPRRIAFLVGGTPAHAPAYADVTGTVGGATVTERVLLPTGSTGARVRGAVSSRKAFEGTDLSIAFPAGTGTAGTVAIGLGLAEKVADLRVIVPIETWLEGFRDRALSYAHLDVGAIDEIVIGASGKIDGALGTPNGNYDVPFPLKYLGDVARITRDFALAEAGKVRPNTMQVDYVALRREADKDLEKVRTALSGVGEKPPDPAKNVGGAVGTIGVDTVCPPPSFSASLGDFA